jgi:hypothetical protein
LQRGVVSFTVPLHLAPGRYTLETAAVDRESMRASVRRSALVVRQGSGLSMSDVVLVRRVDPLQEQADESDPLQAQGAKITPELSGTISLKAGEQVRFYAAAFPEGPIDAPIEASIGIWRDGKVVMNSPMTQVATDATGRASILAGVPAERLTSGQYEVQVSFQYKGGRVTRMMSFTVAEI